MIPRQQNRKGYWERLVTQAAISLVESKRKTLYVILFALSWVLLVAPLVAIAVMMLVHSLVSPGFTLILTALVVFYVSGVGLVLAYHGWVLSKDPNFIDQLKNRN